MPAGVVDEVADDPSQLAGVAGDLRRRHPGGVDVRSAGGALGGAGLVEHDVVEVDELGCERGLLTGIAAGEQQQVVDERLQAAHLLELAAARRRVVGAARVVGVHLQLGPHPRQRRAQLVGGVGDEPLLALGRAFETVEHGVHRLGQPGDLVTARRDRHPPVELPAADRRDLRADPLDRSQRAPDDDPDQGAEHERRHRDDPEQRRPELGDALVDVLQRSPEVHDGAAGGASPGRHQKPPVAVEIDLVRVVAQRGGQAVDVAERFTLDPHLEVTARALDDEQPVIGGNRPVGARGQRRRDLPGLLAQPVFELLGEAAALTVDEDHADDDEHGQHADGGDRGDLDADATPRPLTGHPAPRPCGSRRRARW